MWTGGGGGGKRITMWFLSLLERSWEQFMDAILKVHKENVTEPTRKKNANDGDKCLRPTTKSFVRVTVRNKLLKRANRRQDRHLVSQTNRNPFHLFEPLQLLHQVQLRMLTLSDLSKVSRQFFYYYYYYHYYLGLRKPVQKRHDFFPSSNKKMRSERT